MTKQAPRRVVTGHDASGKSIFLSDGPSPQFVSSDIDGLALFYEMWNTGADPAPIHSQEPREPNDRPRTLGPAAQGSVLRIIDILPNPAPMPPRADGRAGAMHRTETIDYGLVLEGEIWLVLDDSERLLKAGDVVIQRGTDHAWENRSQANCRMAFILLAGRFDDTLKRLLAHAVLTP